MASLLSWAGHQVKRLENTVHNDVIRPIQRDIVAPVQRAVSPVDQQAVRQNAISQQAAANKVAALGNNAKGKFSNPLLRQSFVQQNSHIKPPSFLDNVASYGDSLNNATRQAIIQPFVTRPAAEVAQTVRQAVTHKPATYTPGSQFEKELFGNAPVASIQKKVSDQYNRQSISKNPVLRIASKPLAVGEAAASVANDLPLVGGAAKGIKVLAETKLGKPAIAAIKDVKSVADKIDPRVRELDSQYTQLNKQWQTASPTSRPQITQAIKANRQARSESTQLALGNTTKKVTGSKAEFPTESTPVQNQTGLVPQDGQARLGQPLKQPSQIEQPKVSSIPVGKIAAQSKPLQAAPLDQSLSKVSSTSGVQERGFIQTVINDPNTSPQVRDSISSLYKVRNTRDLQTKAANLVKANPDVALRVAHGDTSDVGVAVGSELMKHLQASGQYEAAIDLAPKLAGTLTQAGRTSQAASIYGRLTPAGILRFTQRELEKYNEVMKLRGEKQLKLTPEQAKSISDKSKAIQEMADGRAKDLATKEMLKEVYQLMPSTVTQKISTAQTMAQLLNPKTLIRNIGGNTIFGGMDNVSQTVAAGIDKAVSLGTHERTTALPNIKTQFQGIKTGGKQGYEEAVRGVNLGPNTQFELSDIPTFRSGFLSGAEKTMGVALRAPDRAAYQAAFDDTVKGLMKVNKLDKPTPEILEQANANGLYRTFQDNSATAQLFSGLKGALNKLGVEQNGHAFGLGDLILKYPKTPGNLISRGLDYSPVGIIKGLYQIVKPAITHQAFDQHTFANMTARGTVGTGSLVGAGMVLGALGIITEAPSQDTDTRNLQKASGLGGYQINVSALRRFFASGFNKDSAKLQPGDNLVSYDWAQPLSIPLSAGAGLGSGQGAKNGAIASVENLSSGLNTLVEQPLVTGVNTLSTNIKNKGLVGALGESVKGAPASFVPTASNQIRQLTDNNTRNVYDPSSGKQAVNQVTNKIPFLDRKLPNSVDTLGNNKQNYQNGSNNIFNVALNPAFVNKYQPNEAAEVPLNIFDKTGITTQMPRTTKTSQKVNGRNIDLTAKQNHDFQQFVGKTTNDVILKLKKDPTFQALPPEEQANKISTQMSDINTAAKVVVLGNQPAKLTKNALSIAQGYGPIVDLSSAKASSGKALSYKNGVPTGGSTTTVIGANGQKTTVPTIPKATSATVTTYDPKAKLWTQTNNNTGRVTQIDSSGARTIVNKGIGAISGARPDYIASIRSLSTKYKLDTPAVLAVAAAEGLGGGVGDNGTSFGPFQLHVGGALPKGKDQKWAESPAGIDYALQQISKVAGGKKGQDAITAIVNAFERPADPDNEIANALSVYTGKGVKLTPGQARSAQYASVKKAKSAAKTGLAKELATLKATTVKPQKKVANPHFTVKTSGTPSTYKQTALRQYAVKKAAISKTKRA